MQLKGSDITLPKYSSSTSQIRQKKEYRDKKFTWNIAKWVLFFKKRSMASFENFCGRNFCDWSFLKKFWKNFAEEIFAIDQFWNFFAEEIFANKGQNRKNKFRKNFFRKNFFRKKFLPQKISSLKARRFKLISFLLCFICLLFYLFLARNLIVRICRRQVNLNLRYI